MMALYKIRPRSDSLYKHLEIYVDDEASLGKCMAVEEGMPPDQVAEHVFDAITEERLYILTHPDWKDTVRARMEAILAERNPSSP